jgi:integrase/recombinase XerD
MLRNGARLESVQALLGHSEISSTEVYTKIYPKDLVKMHRKYHPRERQKKLDLNILRWSNFKT